MTAAPPAGRFTRDVAVIGGCGHVGLPLAIAFADRGASVAVFDTDPAAVAQVSAGNLPFREPGAAGPLARALAAGRLTVSTGPAVVTSAEHLIVVIGTPVDASLRPDQRAVPTALRACAPHLADGQLLVLRSTVHPGGTAGVEKLVTGLGLDIDVAFCPERIAEGHAMTELFELPQIVSSRTRRGTERASALFRRLTGRVVVLSPEEAELAKLFTNAWRYLNFAAANQLYMLASDRGLDYERIRAGLAAGYPRAAGLPPAGFAAGPCLLKDTMQLAAHAGDGFPLGRAAMAVNEGLPGYLAQRLERRFDLAAMTVGILGMAFKAGSDDPRASLSYQLKKILAGKARAVLCTDPRVRGDAELHPLAQVLARSDLLVIATPHPEYAGLRPRVPVADIWNVLGTGVLV